MKAAWGQGGRGSTRGRLPARSRGGPRPTAAQGAAVLSVSGALVSQPELEKKGEKCRVHIQPAVLGGTAQAISC